MFRRRSGLKTRNWNPAGCKYSGNKNLSEKPIDTSVYESFRRKIKGEVILPGEPDYGSARWLWNGMNDKHPAVIVRCKGNADVIHAIRFAREHELPVAVRGGGHNVSGNAVIDAGMVVDLSLMRSVHVHPGEKRVWAEGGAKLGDIDHETQAFGLAVPIGGSVKNRYRRIDPARWIWIFNSKVRVNDRQYAVCNGGHGRRPVIVCR